MTSRSKKWIKTIPGLAVSLFFLWFTFRKISLNALLAIHVDRRFLALGLLALACGYTLRVHRWWSMLSASSDGPVSFRSCALVLLTSFGANNIFPLRLGDVMRVFFYSKDLKVHSSVILSTVVFERILDMFALLALLLLAIEGSATFPWPRAKLWATVMLIAATLGMIAMMAAAALFGPRLHALIATTADEGFQGKLKRSLAGGLNSIQRLGPAILLSLVVESLVIWLFEGMVFVSASKALSLNVAWIAPWQALVLANLSTLLPSTPGYIGTFDYAAKVALTTQGVSQALASYFALLVHSLVWIPITVAGGIAFLILRTRPKHTQAETGHSTNVQESVR